MSDPTPRWITVFKFTSIFIPLLKYHLFGYLRAKVVLLVLLGMESLLAVTLMLCPAGSVQSGASSQIASTVHSGNRHWESQPKAAFQMVGLEES